MNIVDARAAQTEATLAQCLKDGIITFEQYLQAIEANESLITASHHNK